MEKLNQASPRSLNALTQGEAVRGRGEVEVVERRGRGSGEVRVWLAVLDLSHSGFFTGPVGSPPIFPKPGRAGAGADWMLKRPSPAPDHLYPWPIHTSSEASFIFSVKRA